ncbi:thiolase family protein [Desulfosporosinus shakirovi]|uniref:thiolase family protein n=1 Tax=Desulfosporosinus shakirovi TaxID=2885154 RepID=UPI001E4AB8E4|nr:thiolase family protein [Desulfosporosinus sp. SRJS8]MCB8817848.1 thiolase family protein [Desulfosporosinus sp. SRJS8]
MSKAQFAIIGTGEVPCGMYPDRTPLEIASWAAYKAIKDAGINKNHIDGVLGAMSIMDNDWNTEVTFGRLPEALGIKNCKTTALVSSGGASSNSLRKTAQGLLLAGHEMVLVIHAQRFSTFTPGQLAEGFAKAGADPEWEIPYGMSFNALSGMLAERYMYETGTTIEQIASVCVAARKWALLQDNAMNKKALTLEQVLGSKMISTPLTAYMCNVLADGGSAFIMTTAERAKKLVDKPVYILGEGSEYSHRNLTKAKDLTRMKAKSAIDLAYQQAGLGPKDMDIAEIYASYPMLTLILFEEMGFCKRGEAGKFFMEGHTSPGGRMPVCTNGEALSFGHTGTGVGIALFVESVRQLQGKAGRAQVPGARFLVENCGGGAFMDTHCSVMSNQLL